MNAKPFTFSDDLIPLVLDGRKTQSRRLDRKFEVGDLFYPQWFGADGSRGWLDNALFEITRVWLEPVRSIKVADIWAEGVDNGSSNPKMGKRHEAMQCMAFKSVINGYYPGIWNRNGLVWAHEWRPAC